RDRWSARTRIRRLQISKRSLGGLFPRNYTHFAPLPAVTTKSVSIRKIALHIHGDSDTLFDRNEINAKLASSLSASPQGALALYQPINHDVRRGLPVRACRVIDRTSSFGTTTPYRRQQARD